MDLTARIGAVTLPNPILAASGVFGSVPEDFGSVDAAALGAVVAKSMSTEPWPGNTPPRVVPTGGGGMLNAVGLQNPGVEKWKETGLPELRAAGVRIVGSIWGRTVDEFARAAEAVGQEADELVALEVNMSCPNVESGDTMFAHDEGRAAAVIARVVHVVGPLPVWAKLSPNVPSTVPYARAVVEAGAAALVLVNTLIGMVIDVEARRPALGNITGGVSGPPLRPIAMRAVYECREALGDIPIVGVGGISRPIHVLEFLMAGADAVEVGSAHLANPKAGAKLAKALPGALRKIGAKTVQEVIGVAQPKPRPTAGRAP